LGAKPAPAWEQALTLARPDLLGTKHDLGEAKLAESTSLPLGTNHANATNATQRQPTP